MDDFASETFNSGTSAFTPFTKRMSQELGGSASAGGSPGISPQAAESETEKLRLFSKNDSKPDK